MQYALKKKKIRIWAWIKLIINTFNVTLRMCWEGCTTFPAVLPAAKHDLLHPKRETWPPVEVGSPHTSNPGCQPLLPHLASVFCPWNYSGFPNSWQRSRGPQSASPYSQSHLRKRSPRASTSLSERGVLSQGGAVILFQSLTMSCDLRAKDLRARCRYFRGRWGNSWCSACHVRENQMLVALRLPIYKVTVPPYPSQVFLPHSLGRGSMVSAGEHHQFKVLQLPVSSAAVFPCPCPTQNPSNCADTDTLRD